VSFYMFVGCFVPLILTPDYSIKRYKEFKDFNKRICVATDVFGRGIDIERINLAINYDMPADADSYLHRVGRAGRFGTKGLAISFVSSETDQEVLKQIEKRFEVALPYVGVYCCYYYYCCCCLVGANTLLQRVSQGRRRCQHIHGVLVGPRWKKGVASKDERTDRRTDALGMDQCCAADRGTELHTLLLLESSRSYLFIPCACESACPFISLSLVHDR